MSINWEPYVCMMTNSTCYKKTTTMKTVGVLWHDTGCDNDTIKRYVQPTEGSKNYDKDIAKIGKNRNGNDWNHQSRDAGVNYFVGRFADDSVGAVQVLPSNFRPWGCGSGSRGSCNDGWQQFEICEDAKNNKEYATQAYEEAVRLTAWICEQYDIDPHGTVRHNGVDVPTILCHWDSYLLGLGSGHDDIYDWFPKIIGKNMIDVRNDVAALMQQTGWVEKDGQWYYYYEGGKFATDWTKIDKKWYFFRDDGTMYRGWHHEGNKWYYLDDNTGVMRTGWVKYEDKWYFMAGSGVMKTGWQKWKGSWYYLTKDGSMAVGWLTIGKAFYYFKADGDMAENEWIKDTDPNGTKKGYYWLSKSGKFTYPHVGEWRKNTQVDKWGFCDDSGWYAKSETIRIAGEDYTFDEDGYLVD